ncbi:MAG: hypothetical protein WBC94_05150 [Xanthobacteraceae bacterium]|jgi:hypothetical protein
MSDVHFYSLKRATPKFSSGKRDEWSIPGALGAEEALKHFERELGFGLRQIHDDDAVGEFVLEQRERILRTVGASVSIQPGNILATSWVRRN